jgi:hypothetical protein
MTARTHETIRVGLRRIIRDDNVSPKVRLDAIELLMKVEGLMDAEMAKNKPQKGPNSDANDMELQRLYDLAEGKKTD